MWLPRLWLSEKMGSAEWEESEVKEWLWEEQRHWKYGLAGWPRGISSSYHLLSLYHHRQNHVIMTKINSWSPKPSYRHKNLLFNQNGVIPTSRSSPISPRLHDNLKHYLCQHHINLSALASLHTKLPSYPTFLVTENKIVTKMRIRLQNYFYHYC